MKSHIFKFLAVVVALSSLVFATLNGVYIGNVFEQKSLYSYKLKTGDLQANSEESKSHIKGKKTYGNIIALRVGVASIIFGVIVGAFGALWYAGRKESA